MTFSNQLRKLTYLVSFFLSFNLIAQDPSSSSSGFGGGLQNGAAFLDEEFRVNAPGEQNFQNIDFYTLRYRTSTLDLRTINQFTKYTVPESIVITPPDLSSFDHTVVLIGLYGNPDDPNIIIWLAGNYDYNRITFHLDFDQDRNFTDDSRVVRMGRGEEPKEVTITTKNGPQTLFLSAPKNRVKSTVNNKKKVINRPVFGFQAGIGSGDLTYGYINNTTGEDVDYYVNVSEKSFGVNGSYYFARAIVGASALFQNHYHYASYTLLDGQQTSNVNTDLHSPNKVQFGLYAAYRQRIGQFAEIQPLVRYGVAQYTNPEYKIDRYSDVAYDLEASKFLEYGFRIEFTAGIENLFFIEILRNKQDWQPLDMPGTDTPTFESRVKITKFNVGFSMPMGN